MFDVEIRTMITYTDNNDLKALRCARDTLETLADLISKSGNGCTEEVSTLKGAAHILGKIYRDEAF